MGRKSAQSGKDDEAERQAILERLGACDISTLRRLRGLLESAGDASAETETGRGYLDYLSAVAESDVSGLKRAEKSYGNSWKRRGGIDTFHMLTRKWDRLEKRVASASDQGAAPYDILQHIAEDRRAEGIIDDVRDLRRYLTLVEAESAARSALGAPDSGRQYLDWLASISRGDVSEILQKQKAYGSSWKRRGGVAVFMMLARKWDRIEQRVALRVPPAAGSPGANPNNIFEHIAADRRTEGILDDVRDLRRYLMLVEAEMAARGLVETGTSRDNREQD
jgi:hypothetical protein